MRPIKPDEYPDDGSLTFAVLKKHLRREHLMFAVSVPLMEVRDWFNVAYNLTDSQIAMLAEVIPQRYWYYTMSELKGALHRKMQEGKVYNRIDPNTIMNWLSEYDLQRDRASEEHAIQGNSCQTDGVSVTMEEYEANLRKRAASGEQTAVELLDKVRVFRNRMKGIVSEEEHRRKEIDFRIYRHNYNKNKKRGR